MVVNTPWQLLERLRQHGAGGCESPHSTYPEHLGATVDQRNEAYLVYAPNRRPVRWLVDMARDACRPPKKPEPEVEMALRKPEPWSREYEAWDPTWTLVRTSNDPFYTDPRRVL